MSVRNIRPSGSARCDSVSRYDLLLAALTVPTLSGLLAAATSGLPAYGGVEPGSLLSVLLLAYGQFYDAPIDTRHGDGA